MSAIILATFNARYIHTSLGLRWLVANLGRLEGEARILEFTLEDQPADVAERILAEAPQLVGLAAYIWNARETAQLLTLLKQLAPDLPVIVGGPEVSHEPLRVDFSAADCIIRGEGELTFARLAAGLLSGLVPQLPKRVDAVTPETAELKLPYHLYTDTDIAHRLIYVEASRGCPFGCEFCLSSLDKRVRLFAITPFLEALENLWQRGARTFKFVDRSFNIGAANTLAILDFFLAKTPPYHVHFEVVPDHFPQELKERLRRFPAGALQLEIGIQTLQAQVAANIGRRLNMDKIRENLRFLATETTAHLHLDLIIGLPGETIALFADNLNRLMQWCAGQGEIQLGILKKLSGTALNRHDQAEAMLYSPEPPYELLQNRYIAFAEMQELKRLARYWDLVYNSGNFCRTAPLLWPEGQVFQGFSTFARWLFAETRATWKIALPRLAGLLFRYLTEQRGVNAETVANALAADLLTVKGRVLPDFVQAHITCLPESGRELARPLARRQDRRNRSEARPETFPKAQEVIDRFQGTLQNSR